jgi:hypothetical protein
VCHLAQHTLRLSLSFSLKKGEHRMIDASVHARAIAAAASIAVSTSGRKGTLPAILNSFIKDS